MKNLFYRMSIFLCLAIFCAFTQQSEVVLLKGPYLGQKPPGLKPEIFAPGIISTDLHEGSSGFNLDSTHFVFQRIEDNKLVTYEMERKNGQWTKPRIVPFAHMMRNGDFVFDPDGKTLYFQSNTPIEGLESEGTISNIWITKKTETSWTEPKFLDFKINTKWLDSFASATTEGTLYFFSRKPGGKGKSDLYKSHFINGEYTEAQNLGDVFNTEEHEWDPFIAPDESYLIFCSTKPEGYGNDDFYISFRNKDLSWSKPVNMGEEINSKGSENRAYVTPDRKYFFFTSTKRGNRDIYWADAGIIETYKPRETKSLVHNSPYLGQKPPGLIPKIFAPGLVSTEGHIEFGSTFSPDFTEYFFTRRKDGTIDNRIYFMKYKSGGWAKPELASFASDCFEFEPHITPKGDRLFFGSRRPLEEAGPLNRSAYIWVTHKTTEGWGTSKYLGPPFDKAMFVCVSDDLTMYNSGLQKSEQVGGQYGPWENIASHLYDPFMHPCIGSNEEYIIFDSEQNLEGKGNALLICFRNGDSTWGEIISFRNILNIEGRYGIPMLSPDGKFLFFTHNGDIYWVDAKIIAKLKKLS